MFGSGGIVAALGIPRNILSSVISELSLSTNLKICLDAGDGQSYNPATQTDKWLDTSGQGTDFFLGATTGADDADPVFWGTADGVSKNEYFRFNGGDYFTYDGTNETWMQSLHKDGAIFSFCHWLQFGDATGHSMWGTTGTSGGGTGIHYRIASTGKQLQLTAYNAGALVYHNYQNTTVAAGTWYFLSGAIDEPSATGFIGLNDTYYDANSAYSNPATGDAGYTLQLAAGGNGYQPERPGSRYAMFAMWSGSALSKTNFTAIYNATKGRFA